MFLGAVVGVFLRRWLLLAVGIGATLGAGYWTAGNVGSEYQASGQLVFLLPPDSLGPAPVNPYLNLQGGLSTVATLAASRVQSADVESRLRTQGLTAEYDVGLAPGVGPLVLVTAKGADPQQVVATRDAVIDQLTLATAQLQADRGIPANQTVSTQRSDTGGRAQVLPGNRIRALASTVAAGGLTVLLLVFLLDRVIERRRPGTPRTPARDLVGSGRR